jgi:hypothetical protein
MLQKYPSKTPSYEKVKMFKKDSFVIESFVTIGSFDYDCTHPQVTSGFFLGVGNIDFINLKFLHDVIS